MDFPEDQIRELQQLFPRAGRADEGGVTFFVLPAVPLDTCTPKTVDALLCPTQRDGYPSRLFVSQQIQPSRSANWNAFRILERNWYAVSWRIRDGLRLAQMALAHLDAFR